MQHAGGSRNNCIGLGRLLSWTKVNRSPSETAKSSNLQYKQRSRRNKTQEPFKRCLRVRGRYKWRGKKNLRQYTEMWKLSGICTCLYIYIYIYISASQQKACYSLTRQMGGHSMYNSKFFFFFLNSLSGKAKSIQDEK